MRSIILFVVICICLNSAFVFAQVKVRVQQPLRFYESNETTTSKQTINGPRGRRTTRSKSTSSERVAPGFQVRESVSDHSAQGVANPGIKVERKVYGPNGALIESPPINGNGDVHTESKTTKRQTPDVQIQLGR